MIETENTNVYSLEVSMYGYKPDKKSDKIVPYTEENCEIDSEMKHRFLFGLSRYSSRKKHLPSTLGFLQNIRAY